VRYFGLICCLRIKYEKSLCIQTAKRRIIPLLRTRKTTSNAHLRDIVQNHSIQTQIFPPSEMFAFLALTLQMRHTFQGRLEDYWTKMEQLRTPTMARARYYHILRFLNFTDNIRNGVERKDDRLWKLRDLFESIKTNFSKFYNPSEHLAVDEVIVKFKGRIVFSTSRKNANVSA
jgi:hypothetical protein